MINWLKEGNAHNKRVSETVKLIKDLFKKTNKELVSIARLIPYNIDKVFRFAENPLANNRANSSISALISAIIFLIRDSSTSEQEAAESAINEFLDSMPDAIKNYAPYRTSSRLQGNDTDIERKVRNYCTEYLAAVELNITTGRQNSYPDSRIVGMCDYSLTRPYPTIMRAEKEADKTDSLTVAVGSYLLLNQGRLINGGVGHYKSSFLNIRRLALTEVQAAYIYALESGFDRMDFIVGYEVYRGSNYDCPICNYMPGFYSKSFVFQPFHPGCYCLCRPRFCTPEEIAISAERIEQGLPPLRPEDSINYVNTIPLSVYQYVTINRDKLVRAYSRGKMPKFITQNPSFFDINIIVNH